MSGHGQTGYGSISEPQLSLEALDPRMPDVETSRLMDSLIAYQQKSAVDVDRGREQLVAYAPVTYAFGPDAAPVAMTRKVSISLFDDEDDED